MSEKVNQGICFCFTLNNPMVGGNTLLEHLKKSGANLIVFQLEQGASGTPHFQGYVRFAKKLRLSNLKKILPEAHWENRKKAAAACIAYCKKEEGRLDGPWEWADEADALKKFEDQMDKAMKLAKQEVGDWEKKHGRQFNWEREWAISDYMHQLGLSEEEALRRYNEEMGYVTPPVIRIVEEAGPAPNAILEALEALEAPVNHI